MVYVTLTSLVVPYIGTWIETENAQSIVLRVYVVPYIGTWIETVFSINSIGQLTVVPYIGTWIETSDNAIKMSGLESYLI